MSRALTIPLFLLAATCMICMTSGFSSVGVRITELQNTNGTTYSVSIVNNFTNTVIHGKCKSLYTRQSLDSFTLQHQGQTKYWVFHVVPDHFHGSHDYRCSLRKGYSQHKTRLVIFKQARDTADDRCGITKVCHYMAAADGIYFRGNGSWEKEVDWSDS